MPDRKEPVPENKHWVVPLARGPWRRQSQGPRVGFREHRPVEGTRYLLGAGLVWEDGKV